MRPLADALHAFLKSKYFYPLAFLACLAPGVYLLWNALPVLIPTFFPDATFEVPWQGNLGVDPTKAMIHATGRDALACLLVALTITPIRRLTGWNRIQIVRRTVGVWAFVYGCLHLSTYFFLDQLGDVHSMLKDVLERKFIFLGMFTWVVLLALAATSTNGMIRRLKRRWQTLHRLAYVAAVTGVIHFAWGQKADIHEPLEWGAYLAVLFGIRAWFALRKRLATRPVPVTR